MKKLFLFLLVFCVEPYKSIDIVAIAISRVIREFYAHRVSTQTRVEKVRVGQGFEFLEAIRRVFDFIQ